MNDKLDHPPYQDKHPHPISNTRTSTSSQTSHSHAHHPPYYTIAGDKLPHGTKNKIVTSQDIKEEEGRTGSRKKQQEEASPKPKPRRPRTEDCVKMTSPLRRVKTASGISKARPVGSVTSSPRMTGSRQAISHCDHQKNQSLRLGVQDLISNWEALSTRNKEPFLTPADEQRTKLENSTRTNQNKASKYVVKSENHQTS